MQNVITILKKYILRDSTIFLIIYFGVLAQLISFAVNDQKIVSDLRHEYEAYEKIIEQGGVIANFPDKSYIVTSSLFMTTIPAHIQRITSADEELVFKIFPKFLYALMPAFIYLISRRYLNKKYALLAAALPFCGYFFMYWAAIGRWGVALGFFAGLIWALTSGRIVWAIIFTICLPLSHYGTTYIAGSLIATAFITMTIWKMWRMRSYYAVVASIAVMVLMIFVWYMIAVPAVGRTTGDVIERVYQQILGEKQYIPIPPEASPFTQDTTEGPSDEELRAMVGGRDPVIAVGLGFTFKYMNIPQKMEFVATWLIVLSIAAGVIYSLWKRRQGVMYLTMATAASAIIVASVAIPYLSYVYGIVRVYHTSLVVLAPMYVAVVADNAKISKYGWYGCAGVLLVYALCTSGLMHAMWGITK